jgi:uncharacterized protein with PQ loop repeat
MIIGPNIGYIAQIIKFRQVKSSEGFSKLISLITLIGLILRIFFWLGKDFSVVLLYQSIVGIIMQLILLRECLRLSPEFNEHYKSNESSINPMNIFQINSFLNWPNLIDYIYVLSLFSFIIGFVSHEIGFKNQAYVEGLGAAAAMVEAAIGLPQVIINFKNKSCETISGFMLMCWTGGDAFKTFYYFETKAPLQFLICGLCQLTLDLILLLQFLCYKTPNKEKTYFEDDNKLEFEDDELNPQTV